MAPSRLRPVCLLACLWCFGEFGSSVWGAEVLYNWEVKYMKGAPDCMEKDFIIGINGQFPGPTINARAGDNVVVYLTNKLDKEGVVIHWHGIRQLETPWADGTAAISQCPIKPRDTFKYNFTVEKVCIVDFQPPSRSPHSLHLEAHIRNGIFFISHDEHVE